MSYSEDHVGYVLFGYGEGISFYNISGCATDFKYDQKLNNLLIETLLIKLEYVSLDDITVIFSYAHVHNHNDLYTFYCTYFRSKDFIGRTAYQGVSLLLKNSHMNSIDIRANLAALENCLKNNSSDTNNLTLELGLSSKIYKKYFDDPIINDRFFIKLNLSKQLINFFDTSNKANFYKVYTAEQNFFREVNVRQLDESFLQDPELFYETIRKDSTKFLGYSSEKNEDLSPVINQTLNDNQSNQSVDFNANNLLNVINEIENSIDEISSKLNYLRTNLEKSVNVNVHKKGIRKIFKIPFIRFSVEKLKLILLSVILFLILIATIFLLTHK